MKAVKAMSDKFKSLVEENGTLKDKIQSLQEENNKVKLQLQICSTDEKNNSFVKNREDYDLER